MITSRNRFRALTVWSLISAAKALLSAFVIGNAVWATDVSGGVSGTWSVSGSPYIVKGDITVDPGSVLTIDQGVEVHFDGFYRFDVDGTLVAIGSGSNPIVFKSAKLSPGPGDWKTIRFSSTSSGSSLKFASVSHAGFVSESAAITCDNASPAIGDITIIDSGMNGVALVNSSPAFSGVLSLSAGNSYLILADLASQPSFSNATLSSTDDLAIGGPLLWSAFYDSGGSVLGTGAIAEVLAGTMSASSTWGGVNGIDAIELQGTLTIEGALLPVLTLVPGTVIRTSTSSGRIVVGSTGGALRGGLWAVGNTSERIRFEGAPSGWLGIDFRDGALDGASKLQFCDVIGGGGSDGVSTYGAAVKCSYSTPVLDNLTIDGSTLYGLSLLFADVSITNCQIINTTGTALIVDGSAAQISELVVTGFGTASDGIRIVNSPNASLSGAIQVLGPGGDGLEIVSSSCSVDGVTVHDVNGYSIKSFSSTPSFNSIVFSGTTAQKGSGSADFWASLIDTNLVISSPGFSAEITESTLSRNSDWDAASGITSFEILGSLSVIGPNYPILTLAAGTHVEVEAGKSFFIGTTLIPSTQGGSIVISGTASEPVVIEGRNGAVWGSLFIFGKSGQPSSLSFCEFDGQCH